MRVSKKTIRKIKITRGCYTVHIPDKLKHDLDICIDDMKNSNMDICILIDGQEGSGKTYTSWVLGRYISWCCGIKFNPDCIHFNVTDYIKAAESNGKFHINILDESREAVGKRRALSKQNVLFTNYLSECRSRQQVHIIILPAVHDIDTYISMWRMKFVIHHYLFHTKDESARSGYKLVRGYFKLYENSKTLQNVIFNKARYGNYSYPKIGKYHRKIGYTKVMTEQELKQYEEKKTTKRGEKYKEKVKKDKYRGHITELIKHIKDKKLMTHKDISTYAGIDKDTIYRLIKEQDDVPQTV